MGRETTTASMLMLYTALNGLCISCALLVDFQPELAQDGMIWLGIFMLVVVLSACYVCKAMSPVAFLLILFSTCICFTSARCVEGLPRLAKAGMCTLVAIMEIPLFFVLLNH